MPKRLSRHVSTATLSQAALVLAPLLALAACGPTYHYPGPRDEPARGGEFHSALQKGYWDLGAEMAQAGDADGAARFRDLSRTAFAGKTLGTGYAPAPGDRERDPVNAAAAQVAADCLAYLQAAQRGADPYDCRGRLGAAQERLAYRPPPPAPPPPLPYEVHFEFGKADLTAEAQTILRDAAGQANAARRVRITLDGHTDTVDTPQYNRDLSQRRADAVAAFLSNAGVPRDTMAITAHGEDHLKVPTADNVREPANRRVEIVVRDLHVPPPDKRRVPPGHGSVRE